MSRLQELKEECAKKFEFKDWNDLRSFHILEDIPGLEEIENDVIMEYAEECVKASLEKASENAYTKEEEVYSAGLRDGVLYEKIQIVDKETITNIENIVLL